MEEYRARHHAKFLEREREREEKEKKERETLEQLDAYIGVLGDSRSIPEVVLILKKVLKLLDGFVHETLVTRGLMLLKAINENGAISVNLVNAREMEGSQRIMEMVREVLLKCGLEAGDIDLEFDMDTAGDEEMARRLAFEEGFDSDAGAS